MENLPAHIGIVFGLTTLLTVILFYFSTDNSKATLFILLFWLVLQAIVAHSFFYTETNSMPPRFLLLVLPPLFFILGLFVTSNGKKFIDSLDGKKLMLVHTVRIPVEIVLLWLSLYKVIPELMTFEGRNFDIVSGLTAPLVMYFGYVIKKLDNRILLLWNFICLGLLINIVANAVLSAPFPFQQFAFDQPNVAVLYFPFVWLPSCVVPLVLFSHLVAIRVLLKEIRN